MARVRLCRNIGRVGSFLGCESMITSHESPGAGESQTVYRFPLAPRLAGLFRGFKFPIRLVKYSPRQMYSTVERLTLKHEVHGQSSEADTEWHKLLEVLATTQEVCATRFWQRDDPSHRRWACQGTLSLSTAGRQRTASGAVTRAARAQLFWERRYWRCIHIILWCSPERRPPRDPEPSLNSASSYSFIAWDAAYTPLLLPTTPRLSRGNTYILDSRGRILLIPPPPCFPPRFLRS